MKTIKINVVPKRINHVKTVIKSECICSAPLKISKNFTPVSTIFKNTKSPSPKIVQPLEKK